MAHPVIINWNIASFSGWGVFGFNLALHWANDPRIDAVAALPVRQENVITDPVRLKALQPFLARSLQFQAELQKAANGRKAIDSAVLVALNDKVHTVAAAHNVMLDGKRTVGVMATEEGFAPDAVERLKRQDAIIAVSSWNERLLRAHGVERVHTVLQGVDPAIFHPAPQAGALRDRFMIFSGGKAEVRKGQDIVLAAFKIFAERHPEAMLVTAWHSPWPELARTLDRSELVAPVSLHQSGHIDAVGWAAKNGIAPDRIIDLGMIPNMFMPPILHEMDVAVFANRAEGGTNLVAMECMACGLPLVLSYNTGHTDLVENDNCYPLTDQRRPRIGWHGMDGVTGWGESQVDEVVAQLEAVFADRAEAQRRGARAAQTLSRLTWAYAAELIGEIALSA